MSRASAWPASSAVELRVQEGDCDVLVYSYMTLTDASEMYAFLKDFFPEARFVIQPVLQ